MKRFCLLFLATSLLVPPAFAPAEPLLYERFESATVGKIEGGVAFCPSVVGHGGLGVPNTRSGLFDGKPGTAVNYGTAKRIASTDFTVEAFVKLAGPPNFDMIASCWNEEGENRSWAFVVLPGGALRFDVSPDGDFHPGNVVTTRPGSIQPGQWYHVAAVSRGDTSRIFINGREMAKLARPNKGIFAKGNANLKIGNADRYATEGPRPLRGNLDEVRITLAALAPAEFVKTKEPMPEIVAPGPPKKYEMPFVAKTQEDASAWQARARARLLELVGRQVPRLSTQEVPINPQLGDPEDKGSYTLQKISFQGNNKEGKRWRGLLAIPKGKGPFPAMLAIHGHGGSAEAVFDSDPKNIYHGLADRFARGGYVVLAPSFTHQTYAANVLWDLFRCVDILASRPEVDKERIGVGGLSMGGEWTMWIAACDPRLKVAVVSGWMCTSEGVFSVPNCECWQLPGLVGLMDICEVHLAIAPRPAVFESAEFDGCFPIRFTREGFQRIRAGYKVFGAEDAVAQDVWPAGHEWHGAVAYPTVDKTLGGHAAKAK
jgi:hypothetical protein